MRDEEFKLWLCENTALTRKAIKDCVSRCKKVESSLDTDLDNEYKDNGGRNIQESLVYTPAEQRSNKEIPKGFVFRSGANPCCRFRDRRAATKKYFNFCEETAKK